MLPRAVKEIGLFNVFETSPPAKKASPWKQVAILPLQPKVSSTRKNYCSHDVPQKEGKSAISPQYLITLHIILAAQTEISSTLLRNKLSRR